MFRAFVTTLSLLAAVCSSYAHSEASADDARSIARLYSAAFDREPKTPGLNFWIQTYEDGADIRSIANKFNHSEEFSTKYGVLNNRAFVEQLFKNVLGRPGNDNGIAFWTDLLDTGKSTRAITLYKFSDSPENIEKTSELFRWMAVGPDGSWGYSAPGQTAAVLSGTYHGAMLHPENIFFTDSVDLTVSVNGGEIEVIQKAFTGSDCNFVGTIDSYETARSKAAASGTYKCSDFSKGTWKSSTIARTSEDTLAAEIITDDGKKSTEIRYSVFADESRPIQSPAIVDSGSYLDLAGGYEGYFKATSNSCHALPIGTPSSDTDIEISGTSVLITQDSFLEGTCKYEGKFTNTTSAPYSAKGTFECSDFSEGSWSSTYLTLTGPDTFVADLDVTVPAKGCEYSVKYLGFKPDSVQVDPVQPDPGGVTEPKLTLEKKSFFGTEEISLPYLCTFSSCSKNSQVTILGASSIEHSKFTLTAVGKDFVIHSLVARDYNNVTAAAFKGLSEGMLIPEGTSVEFSLTSGLTGGKKAALFWSFEIDNLGVQFSDVLNLTTN